MVFRILYLVQMLGNIHISSSLAYPCHRRTPQDQSIEDWWDGKVLQDRIRQQPDFLKKTLVGRIFFDGARSWTALDNSDSVFPILFQLLNFPPEVRAPVLHSSLIALR